MDKIDKIVSTVVLMMDKNIDTDQIIPSRFLKATERVGFGENLFADKRYTKAGAPDLNFPLNKKMIGSKILVVGSNFGCGSSREHAAWALYDYGFKAIIASSLADIFKSNSLNIGLLPVVISEQGISRIEACEKENSNALIEIDLENQLVIIGSTGETFSFEINHFRKQCLLNGWDETSYLLNKISEIENFEKNKSITHQLEII